MNLNLMAGINTLMMYEHNRKRRIKKGLKRKRYDHLKMPSWTVLCWKSDCRLSDYPCLGRYLPHFPNLVFCWNSGVAKTCFQILILQSSKENKLIYLIFRSRTFERKTAWNWCNNIVFFHHSSIRSEFNLSNDSIVFVFQ